MEKYKVEILTEARIQLQDIATFYLSKVGPASAEKITNTILDELDRLSDFPLLGVIAPSQMATKAGYCMLIVGEYLCFYLISGQSVYITLIIHGSTNYMRVLLQQITC